MRVYIYILFLLTSLISYGYGTGEQEEQNPNDPKYQNMAEEVVRFHLNVTKQDTKQVTVSKVTTQVVAGLLTRIQFRVFLVHGKSAMCNSEIWDQTWKNLRVVTYNCDSLFSNKRLNSRVNSRLAVTRDPKNPKYLNLANEALDIIFKTPGSKIFNKEDIKSVSVTSANVKIGSQITNALVFDVTTLNNGQFECEGVVLESPWKTVDMIDVTNVNCDISKGNATKGLLMRQSGKKQIGGQVRQNPKDFKYKRLAEESFKRYLHSHPSVTISVKKLIVDKVTTQVVAGTMIRIDFHVDPIKGSTFPCKSEIWEKVNDKLDFNVMCQLNEKKSGGQIEQDPKNPKYQKFAEESFKKYRRDHIGLLFTVKELKVIKVTTQVVKGIITRLDFKAIPTKGNVLQCHSEILDQRWLQNKDIKVNCFSHSKLTLSKSASKLEDEGVFNIIDEAITDYFENFDTKQWTVENSAIRSFNKIRTPYGKEYISYSKVDVFASNSYGDYSYYNCSAVFATNKRHEKILIGVNCNKHTSLMDGTHWRDPSDKMYLTLAKKAIKQYIRITKNKVGLKGKYDVVVTFAVSSLAAGRWYAINFVVRPLKVNVKGLKCYTHVWEDLKGKQTITEVTCDYNNTNQKRFKTLKL
ncbi:uncharacterized protein LOC134748246 [Cydia strobilella]|uniref:uncharacterized protein LOC134748246 n=1 Tax=Cydia strobilella TaxID=1100964 RepID=UPI0030076126